MDKPPIINHFNKLPRPRRIFQTSFTALGWLVYAYFWIPVITLFAWALAAWVFDKRFLETAPLEDPFVMLTLPLIAFACGVLLVGWAEYNRRRFAHYDRRRRRPDASADEVALWLGASPEMAKALRNARISIVHLNDGALPVEVRCKQLTKRASKARSPA